MKFKIVSSKNMTNHPHKKNERLDAGYFIRITKGLGRLIRGKTGKNHYVKTIHIDEDLLGSNRNVIRVFGIILRKKVSMPFEILILQDGGEYLFWNKNHRKEAIGILKLLNYHHE